MQSDGAPSHRPPRKRKPKRLLAALIGGAGPGAHASQSVLGEQCAAIGRTPGEIRDQLRPFPFPEGSLFFSAKDVDHTFASQVDHASQLTGDG